MVPLNELFSIWKKFKFVSCPIRVLMVPVNSLSFRSNCVRPVSPNSSSGRLPCRRLKFKSISSMVLMRPISDGIVPVRTPSSNNRKRKLLSSLSSDGKVPAIPFCSAKVHNELVSNKISENQYFEQSNPRKRTKIDSNNSSGIVTGNGCPITFRDRCQPRTHACSRHSNGT